MQETSRKMDIDEIYSNIDKMCSMKRYKHPTKGYFPTAAEINTYARTNEFEYMIPYLLWLDECLTAEQRKEHKEALDVLKKMVANLN